MSAKKEFESRLEKIKERYDEIIEGLGLSMDLTDEFRMIRENLSGRPAVTMPHPEGNI